MSLILNIDTAHSNASVCLSEDGKVLQLSSSKDQNDHASWLQAEIAVLIQNKGYHTKDLDAVAVTTGPGSYTGLRVGLAAAKGFCFALNVPLITVNSLKLIAFAVKEEAGDLICPLIDARRMEVYTAVYDKNMQEKIKPHALVIDKNSFASVLSKGKVLFCGNGIHKLKNVITSNNAHFSQVTADASHLAYMSFDCYNRKEFADIAYSEPLYLKEFYSVSRQK